MKAPRYASVEDYLAVQDPVKAETLRAIIEFILKNFPGLESKIAWNVPTIHRQGNHVVGMAAYKKHLTFAPFSPRVMEAFRPRLTAFVVFKNCFQLPIDWSLDKALLKDMVQAQLADMDEHSVR